MKPKLRVLRYEGGPDEDFLWAEEVYTENDDGTETRTRVVVLKTMMEKISPSAP